MDYKTDKWKIMMDYKPRKLPVFNKVGENVNALQGAKRTKKIYSMSIKC